MQIFEYELRHQKIQSTLLLINSYSYIGLYICSMQSLNINNLQIALCNIQIGKMLMQNLNTFIYFKIVWMILKLHGLILKLHMQF